MMVFSVQELAHHGVDGSLELLKLLPQGVIFQDTRGRITAANEAAQAI